MELLIPDSWGSPLLELNTCHGKGRGHPCTGPTATKDQPKPAGSGGAAAAPAAPTAGGTRPVPVKVKTVEEAVSRILKGETVELPDVKGVSTMLDKLAQLGKDAIARGEKAPNYDLCKVSVAGTNIFCAQAVKTAEYPEGIPRLAMPQFIGRPVEGSKAAAQMKPGDKEVDGTLDFLADLKLRGIGMEQGTVKAADLKASQSELVGPKVAGMAAAMRAGTLKGGARLVVSRDNYVVDGHHRWAALVANDSIDGKLGDEPMDILRVDAPISEVLHLANNWAKRFGIAPNPGK